MTTTREIAELWRLSRGLGRPVPDHIAHVVPDPDSIKRGVAIRAAVCVCGWRGAERATLELAVDDAIEHEHTAAPLPPPPSRIGDLLDGLVTPQASKPMPQPPKPAPDTERSPGRQAERIVYAIIKQLSSMSPTDSAGTLGNCWNAAPHVVRAELATKWIEIAEAILKSK